MSMGSGGNASSGPGPQQTGAYATAGLNPSSIWSGYGGSGALLGQAPSNYGGVGYQLGMNQNLGQGTPPAQSAYQGMGGGAAQQQGYSAYGPLQGMMQNFSQNPPGTPGAAMFQQLSAENGTPGQANPSMTSGQNPALQQQMEQQIQQQAISGLSPAAQVNAANAGYAGSSPWLATSGPNSNGGWAQSMWGGGAPKSQAGFGQPSGQGMFGQNVGAGGAPGTKSGSPMLSGASQGGFGAYQNPYGVASSAMGPYSNYTTQSPSFPTQPSMFSPYMSGSGGSNPANPQPSAPSVNFAQLGY